jgi:hypothetical protein
MISCLFLNASYALLGWTNINPLVGMLLFSMSMALGPLCVLTTVGVLMPLEYSEAGLGMEKSAMYYGSIGHEHASRNSSRSYSWQSIYR